MTLAGPIDPQASTAIGCKLYDQQKAYLRSITNNYYHVQCHKNLGPYYNVHAQLIRS